jgi:hypothetical protein
MQIASFILIHDRVLRQFEEQLAAALPGLPSPNAAFTRMVPLRLQELGAEHPISIPFSTLFPLDQVAERQHARLLSAFEDPQHPSRIGRMAETFNVPIYYVSPPRVRAFATELEMLHVSPALHPEDVETLLGRHVERIELPVVTRLLEAFRGDLYRVYRDAADAGKGVIVLVASEPEGMTSDGEFPRAA